MYRLNFLLMYIWIFFDAFRKDFLKIIFIFYFILSASAVL